MNESGERKSEEFLKIGPRVRVMPIVHGSGDFAIRVRETMLERSFDCLALPLPPSFQDDVEEAVERLPRISVVTRLEGEREYGDDEDDLSFSYVPIDPCQGVIAAIRLALGERIPREFIDLETSRFEPHVASYPDPYALKRIGPAGFAAAVLPAIPRPGSKQHVDRVVHMASRLRALEGRYRSILFVCSMLDWPWVRDAYRRGLEPEPAEPTFAPIQAFPAEPKGLLFLLGELPFLTGLYERGRRELTPDDNLSVDGVKELVLEARDRLKATFPKVAKRITPQLLSVYMRYVRNLSLLERRLTPDLYSLVIAAKQTAGDDFALAVAETARAYPYMSEDDRFAVSKDTPLRMSVDRAEVPGWGTARMVNRLPGQSIRWRTCSLRPKPEEKDKKRWKQKWDPFGMCSWPPEDERIESFHRHVRDQAKAVIGADLARTEKFTSSVMDGLDIRETLRNWHTGDLYVKVIPPSRGSIEIVVFLFDVPADPKVYTHRMTWFAEHSEESTLSFYSSDPMKNLIGPGIAQADYGGALFIFPPRPIPDVWTDRSLNFAETLEERLLAAAFRHSRERHVAVVSPKAPPASWRRLAARYGRRIVHLPISRFGGQMIERIRRVHILNGKVVRSYAADYIRDA